VVVRSSDYVVESKSDSEETEFFAYENVLLFLAADPESALRMAEAKGKQEEEAGDNTLTRNGNPAALRFGGVRKIVECQPQSRCKSAIVALVGSWYQGCPWRIQPSADKGKFVSNGRKLC
jgi:hypothetical protein